MTATTSLSKLGGKPVYFSDCCAGISWPMLEMLADRLPEKPGLILSIGCGSGLLEAMLLHATEFELNIYGVEVSPCVNKHLPEDRLLRVLCTASMHPDAMLASSLVFVYPRKPSLMASYLESFLDGALEQVVWLGHRSDWPKAKDILMPAFLKLEVIEGPGLSEYELLVFASLPRSAYG